MEEKKENKVYKEFDLRSKDLIINELKEEIMKLNDKMNEYEKRMNQFENIMDPNLVAQVDDLSNKFQYFGSHLIEMKSELNSANESVDKVLEIMETHRSEIIDLNIETIPGVNRKIDCLTQENSRLFNKLKSFQEIESNVIPIGFIYVQLAKQADPSTLWPNFQWENVSDLYEGLFFRVEGREAVKFGETQEQKGPGLMVVTDRNVKKSKDKNKDNGKEKQVYTGPLDVAFSLNHTSVFTGSDTGKDQIGIKMCFKREEIHPRNQTVRIWKRID